ncbi:MAG: PIN domain-containing protein [Fibrobacter sp.]|jgi:predicted nucleic acid-binding protein|nr:PIN domain-containing protein [Fibrobacter sp.]
MLKVLETCKILYLDLSVIEILLDLNHSDYPKISQALDFAYQKKIQIYASTLSLEELAKSAFSQGQEILARQYKAFFTHSKNFHIQNIDAEVAFKSAEFRSKYGLKIQDSLQLASAYVSAADTVLSMHSAWKSVAEVPVFLLSEI